MFVSRNTLSVIEFVPCPSPLAHITAESIEVALEFIDNTFALRGIPCRHRLQIFAHDGCQIFRTFLMTSSSTFKVIFAMFLCPY